MDTEDRKFCVYIYIYIYGAIDNFCNVLREVLPQVIYETRGRR